MTNRFMESEFRALVSSDELFELEADELADLLASDGLVGHHHHSYYRHQKHHHSPPPITDMIQRHCYKASDFHGVSMASLHQHLLALKL